MNNKSDFLNHIDASKIPEVKSEVSGIHQIEMTPLEPLDAVTHHWSPSETWKNFS